MNFPIKNIENNFSEKHLIEGELLLDLEKVDMLVELDKNLWLTKVTELHTAEEEPKKLEIEIQLSGNKVKACTCDCDFFQKDKTCSHVVAGLLALRKHLTLKKLKKQVPKKTTTKNPKKLTTSAVLSNITHEDLIIFVREFAKKDRRFAIALKAKFAHAVQLDDSKDKYIQLLQATVTSVKTPKDTINFQAAKQIQKIVKDILEHVDDALAIQHYTEAAAILQAIFQKLTPIIKKAINHQEILLDLLEDAFSMLFELVEKDISPALKEDTWEFCLKQLDRSAYRKYDLQKYFYKLLLSLTTEKNKAERFIQKIDELLEDIIDKRQVANLLLAKMSLLEKFYPKKLNEFVDDHLLEPQVLLSAVENAIQQQNFEKAKQLATKGLDVQKLVDVKNQLEEHLLEIALKTQEIQDITKYARIRFLVTFDFNYFKLIKNATPENWENERADLIEEMKLRPYMPQKKEVFAKIFAHENLNGELLQHIQKIRSMDLLQQYDEQLLPEFKQEIYELYESLLEGYLKNHMGRKTSILIRNIFYHLNVLGAKDLVKKLVYRFRNEYPERHSLMEELEIF